MLLSLPGRKSVFQFVAFLRISFLLYFWLLDHFHSFHKDRQLRKEETEATILNRCGWVYLGMPKVVKNRRETSKPSNDINVKAFQSKGEVFCYVLFLWTIQIIDIRFWFWYQQYLLNYVTDHCSFWKLSFRMSVDRHA